MISIFRFFFGFARIKIISDNPEIFINLLIENGISVWDVHRAYEYIECCLSFKDYLKIRKIRNTMINKPIIKLTEKIGLQVALKNVIRRKGIIFGVLIALFLNVYLSNFIWIIEVNGTKTIDKNLIEHEINKLNVDLGTSRTRIDTYDVSQKITLIFSDIAWASANIEGSKLSINISEATKESDKNKPAHLVASVDGVIKEIRTTKGEKLVQIGQTVHKGEILVSGVETIGDSIRYTAADGEIIAKTYRTYKEKIQKVQKLKICTDISEKKTVFEILNIKIPLYLTNTFKEHTSYYDEKKLHIFNKKLPIGISHRIFIKEENIEIDYNREQAKSIALANVASKLKLANLVCVDQYQVYCEEDQKNYYFTIELICTENIAKIQNIDMDRY